MTGERPRRLPNFTIPTVLALALLAGGPPAATGADPARATIATGSIARGTLEHRQVAAPTLHEAERSLRVYLPHSYFDADSSAKRYPVVFMLHGWPGGDGNWSGSGHAGETLDTLISRGQIPELIAIFPDGNGHGLLGRSIYVNAAGGRGAMEDFICRDLVDWADSTLRTIRDRGSRAVIGLSDGGTGALNLAFHHPDLFSKCAGHSGAYRMIEKWDNRRLFGSGATAESLLAYYSPTSYAKDILPALRSLTIYFDVGVRDGDLESNRELDRELTRLGVEHTYHEFQGGHSWGYWREHLDDSLLALFGTPR